MTLTLSRRLRRAACAPVTEPTGCTCALRHPSSWVERQRLVDALKRARLTENRDLAACLAARLSTPCRTNPQAAARRAGADWLEGGVQ